MRIKIIQIGKTKDSYLEEGAAEYLKRLGAFADVEIITLKEVSASKTFSREKCVAREGEQILKALGKDDFVVVLDENGKQMNSREFAVFLGEKNDEGRSMTFVIGGPYGIAKAVKERARLLSFSKMTFTHQMIRLFLLEQIYRGFSILKGKDYHHD